MNDKPANFACWITSVFKSGDKSPHQLLREATENPSDWAKLSDAFQSLIYPTPSTCDHRGDGSVQEKCLKCGVDLPQPNDKKWEERFLVMMKDIEDRRKFDWKTYQIMIKKNPIDFIRSEKAKSYEEGLKRGHAEYTKNDWVSTISKFRKIFDKVEDQLTKEEE